MPGGMDAGTMEFEPRLRSSIVDGEGREVGTESARRLNHEDVLAAPILSGLEGEDVCDWQLPMLDGAIVWLFPGLWTKLSGATPPPW